jgi:hypothetical protein
MTASMNRAHSVPENEFSSEAGSDRSQSNSRRKSGIRAARRAVSGMEVLLSVIVWFEGRLLFGMGSLSKGAAGMKIFVKRRERRIEAGGSVVVL